MLDPRSIEITRNLNRRTDHSHAPASKAAESRIDPNCPTARGRSNPSPIITSGMPSRDAR